MYKINAGIFAAGKGERFKKTFPDIPKPLIPVAGKTLIEISISNLLTLKPSNITVLLNNENFQKVSDYIKNKYNCDYIALDSKSSFESFYTLASYLTDKKSISVLSTVDVVISGDLIKKAVNFHIENCSDITLGISDIPPDEKPLLVEIDKEMRIASIGKSGNYATNGIYILSHSAIEKISLRPFKALREFLATITQNTNRIHAFYFENSFDIDDETDIIKAKNFLEGLKSH